LERHRYGPGRSEFGELALPASGDGPFPVCVLLHGGFWKVQYGRKLMHPLAADLSVRGWAVWNLEYRRLGMSGGGGFPETFDDVAAGIDHLQDLADGAVAAAGHGHPQLDLARVVAIGHSAGGHLAAWAATRRGARVPITAVVSQAGVVDLELAWELRLSGGIVRRLLRGTPEEAPARYADASPAARRPLGVPIRLVHGGRDAVVPPVMSERFAERARAAGDAVDLVVVPEEEHMGHLDPGNELWRAALAWLG